MPSAPRSSDQEFVRRIYFDITGRIPSRRGSSQLPRKPGGNKREELIDKLLYSPEFNDKWSVWFMDLISMTEGLVDATRGARRSRAATLQRLHPRRDVEPEAHSRHRRGDDHRQAATTTTPRTARLTFAVLASAAMGPHPGYLRHDAVPHGFIVSGAGPLRLPAVP